MQITWAKAKPVKPNLGRASKVRWRVASGPLVKARVPIVVRCRIIKLFGYLQFATQDLLESVTALLTRYQRWTL